MCIIYEKIRIYWKKMKGSKERKTRVEISFLSNAMQLTLY